LHHILRAGAHDVPGADPTAGPSAVLDRLPSPFRAVGTAAGTTLLLAGMLTPWWLAAVLFVTVLLVRLLRDVHPAWLERWRATTAQVPALLRLGLGFVVVQGLATGVERAAFGGASFAPVALFVAAAVLVFAALLPGPPTPAGSPAQPAAARA